MKNKTKRQENPPNSHSLESQSDHMAQKTNVSVMHFFGGYLQHTERQESSDVI